MPVTVGELARDYPVLYHMAAAGSWPSIKKHGLLDGSEAIESFREGFATCVADALEIEIEPDGRRHLSVPASQWVPRANELISALGDLLRRCG